MRRRLVVSTRQIHSFSPCNVCQQSRATLTTKTFLKLSKQTRDSLSKQKAWMSKGFRMCLHFYSIQTSSSHFNETSESEVVLELADCYVANPSFYWSFIELSVFQSSSKALDITGLVNIQRRRYIVFQFKVCCAEQPQVRASVWGTHGSLEGSWKRSAAKWPKHISSYFQGWTLHYDDWRLCWCLWSLRK